VLPSAPRVLDKGTIADLSYQDILFDYNAQHDCFTERCGATGTKASKQERKDSGKTERIIERKGVGRFVLNTHGFHKWMSIRIKTVFRRLVLNAT
jgi:hypothetical protein